MPRFEKGREKTGGRQPGVGNRVSLPKSAQTLAELKRYPIAELVKIADALEDLHEKKALWLTILDRVELPPQPNLNPSQIPEGFSLGWLQQTTQKMISAGAPPEPPELQS